MVKNEGYEVVTDPDGNLGPYAFKGRQWVGYDDKEMIRRKSEYVRKMGLGGGMIWALDLDDFSNRCGEGAHPLLSTIKSVLGPARGQYPGITDAAGDDQSKNKDGQRDGNKEEEEDSEAEAEAEAENDAYPENDNQMDDNSVEGDYKVVCYYTNWAFYRPGIGKYKPENIDESLCTHIVYGFAVLNPNTMKIRPHDGWADISNSEYCLPFREKYTQHLKEIIESKILCNAFPLIFFNVFSNYIVIFPRCTNTNYFTNTPSSLAFQNSTRRSPLSNLLVARFFWPLAAGMTAPDPSTVTSSMMPR